MKSTTKTFLSLLIITIFLSSCNVNMFNSVSGNKNVVTENRTSKENFTKITVSSGLDLELTQGTQNEVILEADENLHDFIFTEIKNGTLKIYTEKNIWSAKSKKILVTVNNLESLVATSGAEVSAKQTITTDAIKITATSGAEIDISLEANSVITIATSGAEIEVSGTTEKLNAIATSGADIETYKLVSKEVSAKATSGANINVFASELINATSTSAGDIRYKGNPKKVQKLSNSGGSISEK